MLIFRRGIWIHVTMPDYVDPFWGFGDRLKAAGILYDSMTKGYTYDEAWSITEREIYMSLGVLGKEHSSPKYQKEKECVKEES